MRRKWVYRIGVIALLVATLQFPFTLVFFGITAKGKVVEIVFQYSNNTFLPTSSYPRIEFDYNGKTYSTLADENEYLLVGEEVNVVFLKSNPSKAKIKSFSSLFLEAMIVIPIGLLIWWAFFKSYPNMFKPRKEGIWYENLFGRN